MVFETVTALDIQDGDIIFDCGYRCVVSGAICHLPQPGSIFTVPVARFKLHSAPNDQFKLSLPTGYEGMAAGGNKTAMVSREVKEYY